MSGGQAARFWLWALCLLGFWLGAVARADDLSLRQGVSAYEPYPQLRYFCSTPDAAPTLDQLPANPARPPWKPVGNTAPTFFTDDICWFHLTISNQDHPVRDWMLEIPFPFLNDIQVHIHDEQSRRVADYVYGHMRPVSQRVIADRYPVFPLTLPPGSRQEVYLRVKSDHLQLPLTVVEHSVLDARNRVVTLVQGIFFGGMAVMFFYNLMLWAFVRDRVYLYYVFMVFVVTLFQFDLQGLAKLYLWPETTQFASYATRLELPLILIADSLFFLSFLELRRRSPGWARWMRVLVALGVVQLLAVPLLPNIVTTTVALGFLLLLTVSGMLVGLSRMAAGDPEARIFSVAWGCLIFGGALMLFNKIGVLPRNTFTENLFQLGSFLEAILMSMALASRINRLETARLVAEQGHALAQQKALLADQQNQAKGEFLAKMSHEIRTPMNGVLGFAQLMQETPLTPAQRNYLEMLLSSGEILLTVINDILDYSKIESGKLTLESIPYHLPNVLAECVAISGLSASRKSVELVIDLDPDVPVWVQGDPVRLRQILLNLLNNAIKFTPQGTIHLRARVLSPAADPVATLSLEVEDCGIGMSPEQVATLFQTFRQAESSTTRRYGGTGLGLAICKQLVGLMDGEIGVDSVPGQGSTFRVRLSLPRAQPPTPRSEGWARAEMGAMRVLVAEDNPVNLMVISGMLGRLGIQPLVAADGREAVELVRRHAGALDLVLMDCEMPGLDGFEATRQIRALEQANRWPRLPVIALTAHVQSDESLAAGMDDHLSKPLVLKALADMLEKWKPAQRPTK